MVKLDNGRDDFRCPSAMRPCLAIAIASQVDLTPMSRRSETAWSCYARWRASHGDALGLFRIGVMAKAEVGLAGDVGRKSERVICLCLLKACGGLAQT